MTAREPDHPAPRIEQPGRLRDIRRQLGCGSQGLPRRHPSQDERSNTRGERAGHSPDRRADTRSLRAPAKPLPSPSPRARSALEGADPPPATWAAVLLAVAPAPVAALAAFAPAWFGRLAAVLGVVVLVAGIAGAVTHTGLFFVPALAVMIVAAVRLWRDQ
jgi:hypothetical protein